MLKQITQDELIEILKKHEKWVRDEPGGERADLSNTDLKGIDLTGAFLPSALLNGANFENALMSKVNFMHADLVNANFTNAIMPEAKLRSANLSGANLTNVDFTCADLAFSIMYSTKLKNTILSQVSFYHAIIEDLSPESENVINYYFPITCPSVGSFIGWKQAANSTIVKLCIPEDAKRSSAFGRKCRCNKAICLAIEKIDGSPASVTSVPSRWDKEFIYEIGKEVCVNNFDENRFNECAPGIHFFITREEAENYAG